jgi:hypothetical protein
MASSFISHFFLLRQEKVTKKKATPIRHPFGIPCVARLVRRLRNSHDPLRGHVLKHNQRLGWRRLPA